VHDVHAGVRVARAWVRVMREECVMFLDVQRSLLASSVGPSVRQSIRAHGDACAVRRAFGVLRASAQVPAERAVPVRAAAGGAIARGDADETRRRAGGHELRRRADSVGRAGNVRAAVRAAAASAGWFAGGAGLSPDRARARRARGGHQARLRLRRGGRRVSPESAEDPGLGRL